MNIQRAKEIASSPVLAKNETARIYPLDQPEDEQEVTLNSIIEIQT